MAGINVQMGVSGIAQFKSAMSQAQQSVKTLDAQLKLNEKQYQATGDKEEYLRKKTELLKKQLDAQKTVVKNAEQALKTMTSQGVDKASAAYQKMEQQLARAQSALLDTENAMSDLGNAAAEAADQTSGTADALNSIGKKVSLDAVINGIDRITTGLTTAISKAVDLGNQLFDMAMDSARRADDASTAAQNYEIEVERYLKLQQLIKATGDDYSVDNILSAWSKLKRNISADSETVQEAMEALGVSMYENIGGKYGDQGPLKDSRELFFELGKSIRELGDEYKREEYAQALFGRGWREVSGLFEDYPTFEAYNEAMQNQQTITEEQNTALAEMNAKYSELEGKLTTLKDTVMSALAPGLTQLAEQLSGFVSQLNEYLQSDEGKEKLEALSQAVTNLFTSLTDVDFGKAMDAAKAAIDALVKGLEWLADPSNQQKVVSTLEAVAAVLGTLVVSNNLLSFMQLLASGKFLFGGKGSTISTGSSGTTAAAASGGAGFWGTTKTVITNGIKAAVSPLGIASILLGDQIANSINVQKETAEKLGQYRELIDQQEASSAGMTGPVKDAWDLFSGVIKDGGSGAYGDLFSRLMQGMDDITQGKDNEWFENIYNNLSDGMAEGLDSIYEKWLQLGDEGTAGDKTQLIGDIYEDLTKTLAEMEPPEVEVAPVPDVVKLQEDLSSHTFTIPVTPSLPWMNGTGHANGLPYVPFDGYPAILHKGERVLTASANQNYTYNSNTYFGSVNLNNGLEIDALTESIARQNRRQRAGFGT